MNSSRTATEPIERLTDLSRSLANAPGFSQLLTATNASGAVTVDGVWGAARALFVAALLKDAKSGRLAHSSSAEEPWLCVFPHADDLDEFADDLANFSSTSVERFPAWDAISTDPSSSDSSYGRRIALLKTLSRGQCPPLITANMISLLQTVPSAQRIAAATRNVGVGEIIEPDELCRWLVSAGFEGTTAVATPGEFSRHGGIVDVFAPDWENPVRIEFFGDVVESLRTFDVISQRSLQPCNSVAITFLEPTVGDRGHLADFLPAKTRVVFFEPGELEEEGRRYLDRMDHSEDFHTTSASLKRLLEFGNVSAERIAVGALDATWSAPFETVERFSGDVSKVRGELDAFGGGQKLFLVCQTEAEIERLTEILGSSQAASENRLHFTLGKIHHGFRMTTQDIVVVGDDELFHRADVAGRSRGKLGKVIDSFLDLRPGDYVVHLSHGVGRFRGLTLLEKDDQREEHLELEFHNRVKIYVPASKIHLVQKYVGGTKSRPTLARIGGKAWVKQKQLAEEAVVDLASDLLELQAARAARPGIRFPENSEWQREFEASFPYVETDDQFSGASAIASDMGQGTPMDRLVCGDVGFGKTELAMRAAFRAIDAGYQVAVLVPTTILAEQHYRTFRDRMAQFPFHIASLSRFSTKAQQAKTIELVREGEVDVVIGTHRLAQRDVQFHNLGLVIIDEEQRFGVDVKERLKQLRAIVDVLTMTATPIPRTLHMSLLGLRDISNLETPPADRQAVETYVNRFDADLVRRAVVRELNRGGQIFFVHNRVEDIEVVAKRLRQIVPEVSISIAHGQMPERELEKVMVRFIAGKRDLLLATTIIESGLDIPNANTIFINEADRYGLADLHQLRGRVGRYKHRAYCYLLVDPNKALNPNAARRLQAIQEYSHMGAGFALAMRDLEIRGAGNILGSEQSGHINAIGYELYCELLERAVRSLKKLPPRQRAEVDVDLPAKAFLPKEYVPDLRLKIDLYRRLTRVASEAELTDLSDEIRDRFGPPPEVVERLLKIARIRLLSARWQIDTVYVEDDYVVFRYGIRPQIERLAKESGGRLRVVDGRSAYLPLKRNASDGDAIIACIESLLQAA
ncbi:MAG: transcription-repair coupling factor [Pirellulales bacterium]|nr:transcription-repair coupling factor [Pirellulales bacterium]